MRPTAFQRVSILGAGAWGTALALAARRAGRRTVLRAREASVVDGIARSRRNPFLARTNLPAGIAATSDLAAALDGAGLVLLTTPSQHLRAMARSSEALLRPDIPVVICSKSIEAASGLLMSEIVAEEMPDRLQAVLTNPCSNCAMDKALDQALDMPIDEARKRTEQMNRVVRHYDVVRWADRTARQFDSIAGDRTDAKASAAA